jgi:hypothetical protein
MVERRIKRLGNGGFHPARGQVMVALRLLRRALRRFRASLVFGSLSQSPIFFANSFPKSGTHLLTQVLGGFARIGPAVDAGLPAVVTFEGSSGKQRPLEAILDDLKRLRPGDIAYGHLHALPTVVTELTRSGKVAYFILRDPRDVVVSHVHYVTEMAPDHVHHEFYSSTLSTFEQRLKTSILGLPGLDVSFPNIYQRFEPYIGWMDSAQVLVLRYEDFLQSPDKTLTAILAHAEDQGFKHSLSQEKAIRILQASILPEKSPTFRSGQTGKWRSSFTPQHKDIFKEIAGNLLIRLGYEQDHDW